VVVVAGEAEAEKGAGVDGVCRQIQRRRLSRPWRCRVSERGNKQCNVEE
jgi:hypothetical protein